MAGLYEVTWENIKTGEVHRSVLTAGQMDELMYARRNTHQVNGWLKVRA